MTINFGHVRMMTLLLVCSSFFLLAKSPYYFADAHQDTDIFNTDPSWSPDGQHIVFTSKQLGEFNLWTINKDGTNAVNITTELPRIGYGEAEWSPTGEYIAFSSGEADIWIIEPNGANPENLTEAKEGPCGEPEWSPDGHHIAFGATEKMGSSIWIYDLESHDLREAAHYDNGYIEFPSWSPDGKTIAAAFNDFSLPIDANTSIAFINVDDPSVITLTAPTRYGYGQLDWSPDGKSVVSNYMESNTSSLVSINPITLEINYLTTNLRAFEHDWSPDSSTIVFENLLSEKALEPQYDLWLLNLEDNKMSELVGGRTTDESTPRWSPDGQQIAFQRWENGRIDIWIVDADGSNLINLTGESFN